MTVTVAARSLVKDYGDFRAVAEVDLEVERGEIRAIIGPNGAGKSTLFKMLSGQVRPSAGEIWIDGKRIARPRSHTLARLGVVATFQQCAVFATLSVRENLICAAMGPNRNARRIIRRTPTSIAQRAAELLDLVGLAHDADTSAEALSHGSQRALEIGMAMATAPHVLMLDEPTAGMSALETAATVELVRDLALARGLTILLVEHDMEVVFGVADRITVMHDGAVLAEGSAAEIRENATVTEVYLGQPVPC